MEPRARLRQRNVQGQTCAPDPEPVSGELESPPTRATPRSNHGRVPRRPPVRIMPRPIAIQLPTMPPPAQEPVPVAPFVGLETLWIQVTGTICNLRCTHCFISCSPDNDTLRFMSRDQVRTVIDEAADQGVKEIYFTGGEPFLHPEIFAILEDSLAVAPTSVLTNGVLITERFAARLGELQARSRYALEIRVSLDAPEEEANDAIRGPGVFRRALRGMLRLQEVGLLPIVTASELVVEEGALGPPCELPEEDPAGAPRVAPEGKDRRPLPHGVDERSVGPPPRADGFYRRFHRLLAAAGIARPRVKILPVFNMGMLEGRHTPLLLDRGMLEGFDFDLLQCTSTRLAAHDGVYACPILAGEPRARMTEGGLEGALQPCELYHPSCTTCYLTGMTCRNS